MKYFETRWPQWVLSHRFVVILISAIIVFAFSSGLPKLTFDTSYRVFFSDDNPELLAFERIEETYTKDDNVQIILAPKDGNVFTRKTLAVIETTTTEAWQTPYSNRVDSITNFQFTEAEQDDLIVRDMIKNAGKLSDAELQKTRDDVLKEPTLVRRLISEKGHVTAINITVQLSPEERSNAAPEIMAFVRDIASRIEEQNDNLNTYITGMVPFDQAFLESAVFDSSVLFPIALGLMIVCLALLAGGLYGTFVTVIAIFMSILAAMGAGGHLGFPLTGSSTSIPIIILTVAVANAVHVLVTFNHGIHQGLSKHEAMQESLRVNIQPVMLASLTTAIGFLTMNFSEVPPFQHMGTQVAAGVGLSFLLTISFLPALITLMPIKTGKKQADEYSWMSRFSEFVIAKRKHLLMGLSITLLIAIANLPRNDINDIFLHYFDPSLDFRSDTDFFVDNLTGIDFINFSVNAGDSGAISEPEFLSDIEKLVTWLDAQPQTTHVDSLTHIMKRLNKSMHGDDESFYRLPEERDLAAQYLLLYEMSLPYGLDLNNQINVDKSQTKVGVTTEVMSSRDMIEFNRRALAWANENLKSVNSVESAGVSLMFAYIGQRNNYSMLAGTAIALVLISGVIMLALRSVRIGVISLLPNLAPAAVAFGLWGIFVGEVGLSLSVVAGMTFGIVVDDSVHFLSKYLRARRENGLDAPDAVRYAFNTVGRALMVTTIVLIIGFSVIATSNFAFNGDMGLMTAIIIAIALLTAFLLLPPLLMATDRKNR
ncbi:MAG: efflux RND transporter permease subunit [Gammaproteobacteria bacterium]